MKSSIRYELVRIAETLVRLNLYFIAKKRLWNKEYDIERDFMNSDILRLLVNHYGTTDLFKHCSNEIQIQKFLQRNLGFFLSPPLDGAESLNRWLIIQLPMKSRFKVSKAIEREPQEFDTWGLRRA
jgi:hypothetical protein